MEESGVGAVIGSPRALVVTDIVDAEEQACERADVRDENLEASLIECGPQSCHQLARDGAQVVEREVFESP